MGIDTKPRQHDRKEMLFADSLEEHSDFLETKLKYEIKSKISNLDSGSPLEDYFRATMKKLLPNRFAVDGGTIVDYLGNTCGDCDVVIYDAAMAPLVHHPASEDSRKKYIPFDSVYAIIEVKQSLTLGVLNTDGKLQDKPKGSLADMISKCAKFKSLTRIGKKYDKEQEYGVLVKHPEETKFLNYPYAFGFSYRLGTDKNAVEPNSLTNEFAHAAISAGLDKTIDGICINKAGYLGLTRYKEDALYQAFPLNYNSNAARWLPLEEAFEIFYRRVWDAISSVVLQPMNLIDYYGGNRFLNDQVDVIKYPIIRS